MAASLDGFIAKRDGSVGWMETSDTYEPGEILIPEAATTFLKTIDCYVMGSRTYETALGFEDKGLGWAYGATPTYVLTRRTLRTRDTVSFYAGDLSDLIHKQLAPNFRSIWIAGGGEVAAACLRLGLADEIQYSVLPVVIGDGISFFQTLDREVCLHLKEVKAYKSGIVGLTYDVRK